MAKNKLYDEGKDLSVACTHPAIPASGDPVRVGALCGVALTNERADGTTSVQFRGVFNVSVKGIDGGGNSAVAVGDDIFYVDADTPVLSKKTAGRKFGTALGAVTTGSTATIAVRLCGAPVSAS